MRQDEPAAIRREWAARERLPERRVSVLVRLFPSPRVTVYVQNTNGTWRREESWWP